MILPCGLPPPPCPAYLLTLPVHGRMFRRMAAAKDRRLADSNGSSGSSGDELDLDDLCHVLKLSSTFLNRLGLDNSALLNMVGEQMQLGLAQGTGTGMRDGDFWNEPG